MKTLIAAALAALAAMPAWADATTDAAYLTVLPMLQEMAPGAAGQALSLCVIAAATPEEIAALAVAQPSVEVGAKISEILARPAATACINAAAQ